MDALRDLAGAKPLQKQPVPGLSPDSSRTPNSISNKTPPGKLNPGMTPFKSFLENSKTSPKQSSPTVDPSSPPLEDTSGITMDASSPVTPSRSNLQGSPFASGSPSQHNFQELVGYCAELEALIENNINRHSRGKDGNINLMTSDKSPSSNYNSNPLREGSESKSGDNNNMNEGSPSDEDRQQYRHGQIGAYRQLPRFDQASRPLVSDNWRAKSAADSARPQLSSLVTANAAGSISNPLSPASPNHARQSQQLQPRSNFVYTPTRSPLAAPANPSTAGFAQLSPNPPPTPVSLSTPISMAFPSSNSTRHAHRSSVGSFVTSSNCSPRDVAVNDNNPNRTPASTDLVTTQLSSLALRNSISGSLMPCLNDMMGKNSSNNTVTFPVSIAPDTLGYCFKRPDGSCTRLVPVDMLPCALEGIPARENGNEKLVVLPVPQGVGANGRSSNTQVLRAVVPPGGNSSGDAIQSHIDRILAAPTPFTSSTPAHHHHQHHHPTIHRNHTNPTENTQLTPQPPQSPRQSTTTNNQPKRMKVYCDKWVHEGVCAFTQQGCKYKHEMPADKATQHSLGLFLGYPAWWKRRQGELARLQVPVPVLGPQGQGAQGRGRSDSQIQGLGQGQGAAGKRIEAQSLSGIRPQFGSGLGLSPGVQFGSVSVPGSGSLLGDGNRERLDPGTGSIFGQRSQLKGRCTGRRPMVGEELLASSGAGFGPGFGSGSGRGAGNNLGNGTGTVVGIAGHDGENPRAGNPPNLPSQPRRQGALGNGLAASRWCGGLANDKPIGPSWRAADPSEPTSRHAEQGYDGASTDSRELAHYHPTAESSYSSSLSPINTPTSPFSNGNDTRIWPWQDGHYARRASQTQQYRPQIQPNGTGSSGFNAACTFAFHNTTSPSPYGPIAPPMRSSNSNSSNANTPRAPIPNLPREMANPYAVLNPSQALINGRE